MSVEVDPRIGTVFAGYGIESLLGRDESGSLYLGRERAHDRRVALKLLAPMLSRDERFRTRFLHESALVSAVDHPSIVPIYEAGEADGLLYCSMRYIEGPDLTSLLAREGRLEPSRAVAIVSQLAEALDTVRWKRGLLHGSLGPGDVIVVPDPDFPSGERVFLGGFALRHEPPADSQKAEVPALEGLTEYLAPEQIDGRVPSPRADVYALGCLLFYCLTGEPPFGGNSPEALRHAHLHNQPPSPRRHRSSLPAGIDQVIDKALAKWPEERYSTCQELADAARAVLAPGLQQSKRSHAPEQLDPPILRLPADLIGAEELPSSEPADGQPPAGSGPASTPLWSRRKRSLTARGAVLVLLLAAVVAGTVWLTSGKRDDGLIGIERLRGAQTSQEIGSGGSSSLPSDVSTGGQVAFEEPGRAEAAAEVTGEEAASGTEDTSGASPSELGPHTHAFIHIDPETNELQVLLRHGAPFEHSESDPVLATRGIGGGAVWGILSSAPGAALVARIDVDSGDETEASVQGSPRDLVVSEGIVWVVSSEVGGGWLTSVEPARNELLDEVRLDLSDPVAIAAGAGALWVIASDGPDGDQNALYRVDPGSGAIAATVPLPRRPEAIAVDDQSVWVLGERRNGDSRLVESVVYRIDPTTDEIAGWSELGVDPNTIATLDGAAFVAGSSDWGIIRIDSATNRVTGLTQTSAHALVAWDGFLWITNQPRSDRILRLDPETGTVEAAIDLDGGADELIAAEDGIWARVDRALESEVQTSPLHHAWLGRADRPGQQ